MAVYGVSLFGTAQYGYSAPPSYRVDPFIADPRDYGTISITWNKPAGTILAWRLIKNMYGYPVDQDDGTILIDSQSVPANSNPYFANGNTGGWSGFNGTFSVVSNPPAGTVVQYAGKYVNNGIAAGAAEESGPVGGGSFNAVPGQTYTLNALVYSTTGSVAIGFDWRSNGSYYSTTTQNFSITPNTWTQLTTIQSPPNIPGLTGYARVGSQTADSSTIYIQNVIATPQQTLGYPGNSFSDTNVLPGQFHYYGFYVLVNAATDTWVRSGVTGCLMLNNYNSATEMLDLIPSFYIQASDPDNELEADPTGNPFLALFMEVFGWGLDYLRTQYDTYLNVNNPWKIPLNDLLNLAAELNLNINPDIHPYTLRKAVQNQSIVNKLRGSEQGIAAEISALTGWFTDITIGKNIMLFDDQSWFPDPNYLPWSPYINYKVNETVAQGNENYLALTGNYDNQPPGADWLTYTVVNDAITLANSLTGGISSWELLYSSAINTALPSDAIYELDGIPDPISTSNQKFNALGGSNASGGTTDMWFRSISRLPSEVASSAVPDKDQVASDGIPVPSGAFAQPWSPTTMYDPQDIVTYNNQPFMALRASLNSTPPYTSVGSASQDWEALSFDTRFRICNSAYVHCGVIAAGYKVTPFVEWYDAGGNFILRLFGRNSANGTTSLPPNLAYASFTTGANTTLSASPRLDDNQFSWSSNLGSFTISPYAGGCVYPTSASTRSISTVNAGSVNLQAGLTFTTSPNSGFSTGLLLRYASATSYLRADTTTLKQNNGGTITTLGTYSSAFVAGDRMTVTINGNTITVFKNGTSVLSLSSSFNSTSSTTGIIYEAT